LLGVKKMNQILKTIVLVSLVASFLTMAKQPDEKGKQEDKVEVKCHIELFGGNETIYSRVINRMQLINLPKELVNRNIRTSFSREKQKIYKVHECVFSTAKFTLTKSQRIDEKMAR